MSRGIPRLLAVSCILAILGSLVLHLVAGTACLRAPEPRHAAGCQRRCQRDTTSDSQVQGSPGSLFCCTGLPDTIKIPIPQVLSLAVSLPGIQDLSARLAPSPPPPRFSLFIPARPVTMR
jgi:hypothetical protein